MRTTLFWADCPGQKQHRHLSLSSLKALPVEALTRAAHLCVVLVGLLFSILTHADTLDATVDIAPSASGKFIGESTSGAIRPPAENSQSQSSQTTIKWRRSDGDTWQDWTLTHAQHKQNVQVLGRLNIGPLQGFYVVHDSAHFEIEDLALARLAGRTYAMTGQVRLSIAGGLSGHLIRAHYAADRPLSGYALALAPIARVSIETPLFTGTRTTLSAQAHHSLRMFDFQTHAYRFEWVFNHKLTEKTHLAFGVFHKTQFYKYQKDDSDVNFSMRTQGLKLTLEREI